MRQGLDDSTTSLRFWRVYFHALLAEVFGKAGKVEEAFAALAEAMKEVEDTGIAYYEPELHRVKGELLMASGSEDSPDAEASFRQAIAIARRQGAKSLELRAALSLARLLRGRGQPAEGRRLLAETFAWFTEGWDTPDLQDAQAMLAELASAVTPPHRADV